MQVCVCVCHAKWTKQASTNQVMCVLQRLWSLYSSPLLSLTLFFLPLSPWLWSRLRLEHTSRPLVCLFTYLCFVWIEARLFWCLLTSKAYCTLYWVEVLKMAWISDTSLPSKRKTPSPPLPLSPFQPFSLIPPPLFILYISSIPITPLI